MSETATPAPARPEPSLEQLVQMAAELRGLDLRSVTAEELRLKILRFVDGDDLLVSTRDKRHTWYRARRVEDKGNFASLTELIYPPDGNRGYGRAHLPGASVMYGGWNVGVALEEVGIEKGDIVNIVLYRVRPGSDVRCFSVGNYMAYNQSGKCLVSFRGLDPVIARMKRERFPRYLRKVFVDCVLTEFFGRVNAEGAYYKLSGVYAQFFTAGQHGFIYPSVKVTHGLNLVVGSHLFDQEFEVLEAWSCRIKEVFGYGLYECREFVKSNTFHPAGTIEWGASFQPRGVQHTDEGGTVFDDTPGWRTPSKAT